MKSSDRAVLLTKRTAKLASQLAEARPKLTSRAPAGGIRLAPAQRSDRTQQVTLAAGLAARTPNTRCINDVVAPPLCLWLGCVKLFK